MDMVFALAVEAEAEVIKAADVERVANVALRATREQATADLAEIKNEETQE
jgi:hypothetical protein